jgi:hypothetical protein
VAASQLGGSHAENRLGRLVAFHSLQQRMKLVFGDDDVGMSRSNEARGGHVPVEFE